jgi:hypothetical protein
MPPLTLTILASVLQMQGADATITSDNKGVEDLLAPIRGQLREQNEESSLRVKEASYAKGGNYTKGTYTKGGYGKGYYVKDYVMNNLSARRPGSGFPNGPSGGTSFTPQHNGPMTGSPGGGHGGGGGHR